MGVLLGNLAVVAVVVVVFLALLAGLVTVLMHRQQRINADLCQYLFAAPMDIVNVLPGDFPWVDRKEYDDEQKYLEDSGFRFAGDVEIGNFRSIAANPRAFFRYMLSEDGTVRVSILHGYHSLSYSAVERVFGKMRGRVGVEVSVEARDGRFFTVTSGFAPNPLTAPPEITLETLTPGLGVARTLTEFEELNRVFRDANPDFVPRVLSGEKDAVDSEVRQNELIHRHRVQIGFLTVEELVAGGLKDRDEAEKVVQNLHKELWRRGVMK